MSSYRIAMFCIHTSPLDLPGKTKDAGGMNVYIQELARELARQGICVDIFTRRTSVSIPQIVQVQPCVRVIHIVAGPQTSLHKDELYQYMPAFARHVEEFRQQEGVHYDLIHSHYWISGVAAMFLAERWGVPHVIMFHTMGRLKQIANPAAAEPPLRLEMEQRLLQCVDRVIVATDEEKKQLAHYYGVSSTRVTTIPCGVNLSLFTNIERAEARRHLHLESLSPVVLFVGRLDPFKGPDQLLKAAALLHQSVHIVMVGGQLKDDKDLLKLRRLARDLRIEDHVSFVGAQPREQMPWFYNAAVVTVVPSFHETFGLAAVESLACGTPVIATRAGGLITVVQNGVSGFLVPHWPAAFAERIDQVLADTALSARLSANARPSIERFRWSSVARQVSHVYDEMLRARCGLVAL